MTAIKIRDVTLTITAVPAEADLVLIAGGNQTALGKGTAIHQLKREPDVEYSVQAIAAGYETGTVPVVFDGAEAQTVQTFCSLNIAKKWPNSNIHARIAMCRRVAWGFLAT